VSVLSECTELRPCYKLAGEETAPTNEAAAARALTCARSRQAADDTSRGATRASFTSADTASHNEAPGIAQQLPTRVDS
jgi:hypothetical protein